jgi:hypothetical protein
VLAASYPFLDVLWSMIIFFLFVIWIWILITVFIDIFRSRDLSGWAKALWFLFVLFIPIIGVVVYLIARGDQLAFAAEVVRCGWAPVLRGVGPGLRPRGVRPDRSDPPIRSRALADRDRQRSPAEDNGLRSSRLGTTAREDTKKGPSQVP